MSNGAGYAITWAYVNEAGPENTNYFRQSTATFSNASVSGTSPVVTYDYPTTNVTTMTTPGGRVWRITGGNQVTSVRRPSASSDTTTITRSMSTGDVTSVTNNGVTTNYSRSVSGVTATTVVTDALSHTTTIVSDMTKYRPTSVTDPLTRTTTMIYDSVGRPTEIDYSEGNKVLYGYDGRGNLNSTTRVAKSGSGLSNIVTSANFVSSCTDASCNEPTYTIDGNGNRTDYGYDGTTGLVTSVTAPAPTTGATRPQTRYSYTAVGGVMALTGVSTCQTGSSCAGTSDEVKTTIDYDSNLNIISVSKGAGDASLTATTAATYDVIGNLLTVDGPLSGTADTTTYRYDADRNRVGVISADPDGAGPLTRRAIKTTYNSDGQPTVTEVGTVNGTSDTDWAAFTSLQQSTATYDGNARKTVDTLTAASTTYAVTQYSYDGVGRLQCTAQRMNPSAWSSLPSSACSLGTAGSYGNDRITKATFDAAAQTTLVQTAYGTTDAANEVTTAYSCATAPACNGTVSSVIDANGNKTSYSYDGFDRLVQTNYPSTSAGSGTSSGSDYEQLGYDANSNVTSRRLRDGNSIGYTYDALNRVTYKDLPNAAPDEFDISYTYDLLGRLTHAQDSNTHFGTFWYDALGRETSEQSNWTTRQWQYDLAGRKTRLTWQDGFYISYDYDTLGEMTAVRENGAASGVGVLATYSYDNLGRRTAITRGNGTSTSYGYDAASRLTSLGIDLAGTSYDQSLSVAYNPAGQITSTTRSNDAYAYTGAADRDDSSTINGLNQTGNVGASSIGYDSKGSINSAAGVTYGYTGENKLATSSTGYTMTYDPLGRYHWIANGSTFTWMQYDGSEIVEELQYPSGGIAKRYVWGASTDEPLVEYDASGNRTWLTADERGSIVARSNDSGTATAINTYDEYGVPGASNVGRFQYTGQAWIPELGLYYYKARMYSSRLGRFMQTDPIGYGDGLNWYNFVANDPVNINDPSGLSCGLNEHLGTISGSRITRCLPNGVVSSDGTGSGTGNGDYVFVCVQGCGPSESKGDEIIVTAPLYIAIPVTSYFHHYGVFDPVCNTMASYCSMGNTFDLLLHFPDPGANGDKAVSDNQTSSVPELGPIKYRVDPSSYRVTNITLPGHSLYFGNVSRVVEQRGNIIGIATYGNGNGSYGFLNSLFAGPLWGDTDLGITIRIPYSH